MKANEAPEKIYLFENPVTETPDDRWLTHRSCDSDIEYTRTDAFIERACEYLEPILTEYAGFYVGGDILQHFKKYMKGE